MTESVSLLPVAAKPRKYPGHTDNRAGAGSDRCEDCSL